MEPVVGVVGGQPVGAPDDAEHEQQRVDRAAADQVRPRALGRGGHEDADAEEQVGDVVQNADLEQAEELRLAAVPGEVEAVVELGRDPGENRV